jgi:transcriptional regulator with XRE-family HTH domain
MSGHKPFSNLVGKMSSQARERVRAKTAALNAEMPLHALRSALALSQEQIAQALDIDQPAVSRIERRTDMMLTTLARFIDAMGGTLEVRAAFPEGSVRISGLAEIGRLEKPIARTTRQASVSSSKARSLSRGQR